MKIIIKDAITGSIIGTATTVIEAVEIGEKSGRLYTYEVKGVI